MEAILTNSPAEFQFFRPESGFEFFSGLQLQSELKLELVELQSFQAHWDNLITDCYMADGGKYRQRRFGVFHFHPKTNQLINAPTTAFFQDSQHNMLNGGIKREFAELKDEFSRHDILHSLIRHDLSLLPQWINSQELKIFIHQIRILAGNNTSGRPTPEGIHQDGHLYVAQHLINRRNVSGGESQIYDLKKNEIFKTTLSTPLDSLLVNDPQVFHSVSPITSTHQTGFRDMLLIDFNFLQGDN